MACVWEFAAGDFGPKPHEGPRYPQYAGPGEV